jgi:hypothetical protein
MAKKDLVMDEDLDLDNDEADGLDSDLMGGDLDGLDPSFDDYMGMSPNPLSKHGDLLKDLTKFSPYLAELYVEWLALKKDSDSNSKSYGEYVRDINVEPIMNTNGAMWCISFLKTYVRSNNIITNIGEDDYIHLLEDVIETIWLNLGCRVEDFEIKSDGDLYRVASEMEAGVKLILMGAGDGKYNKFLGTTISRHESFSDGNMSRGGQYNASPQKKGMINRLKEALIGSGGLNG